MDGFRISCNVNVVGDVEDVLASIATPAELPSWLIDVESVHVLAAGEPSGAGIQFRLELGSGRRGVGSYIGENIDVGVDRLAREYTMVGSHLAYTRRVDYSLRASGRATQVSCVVTTEVPGLSPAASAASQRSETRAIELTLARLGRGRPGLMQRIRAGNVFATPL